jgi:hypothetical protein
MHPNCKLLPLVAVCVLLCSHAKAAVVILKGSNQPVVGYLVKQDERTVTLREVLPGGKSREMTFNRGQIDELIVTVSRERLTSLDPSQSRGYLEYAEELAEKQRDPEARETAVRLYAIVAARGNDALRRSALLGLIALAHTPEEERRLRAAAYLFDPAHNESLLSSAPAVAATLPRALMDDLLTALRLIRQGKGTQARLILEKPAVRGEAVRVSSIVSLDELAELCGVSQLNNQQLLRVLRAETALEEIKLGRNASGEVGGEASQWSAVLKPGGMRPQPVVSLQTLTEFDPAECLFRGGKWIKP